MKIETETVITVPFYDADSMNVVWHGNYVKYLEDARCGLLNRLKYNYNDMKNSGYAWPVVTMNIKYIKPCVFMQKIRVKAILAEYENRLRIKYTITDAESGELLSKAETIQMCIEISSMETCFVSPKILRDKVEGYFNG
ncbi:MAG: acyl-CoA thioesterase [Deferribacteraceae bacterium]|jgi:acyl-CoA thioester hydrolase|nr:acyl-CoA thioesterase [Deferribacteraceae bacterium]